MIEPGPGPAIGGVACFTAGTELTVMAFPVIVFAVTRVALLGRFLVVLVSMTGLALCIPMLTN